MHLKKLFVNVTFALVAILLQACGGEEHVDTYEQLERPPQLTITPSAEVANIADENLISNGLGNNIKMIGKKTAPLLKLNLDFDNTWQVLGKALKHQKVAITDHDREQGQYLVNFNTDSYEAETGLFEGLSDKLFAENYGLRKFQLTVKQAGKFTVIIPKDMGAITTEADLEEQVDEVVDSQIKGPEDSEYRLISTLYKNLKDGFVEPENRHAKGLFN